MKIYLCPGFFVWGYIEAVVWGFIVFWSNCLGVVAHCSAFVQGVKLQLSLCPGVQSSSVFFSPGGHTVIPLFCPGMLV